MPLDPERPRWANTGGAQIASPPSGTRDVGWVPGTEPPAQFFNWLLLQIYRWVLIVVLGWQSVLRWTQYAEAGSYAADVTADFSVLLDEVYLIRLDTTVRSGFTATLPQVLTLAHVQGGVSALTVDTKYCVYMSIDAGGNPMFLISVVQPTGQWMTGESGTWRYMFTFITKGLSGIPGFAFPVGKPIPFMRSGRRTHYRVDGYIASVLTVNTQSSPAPAGAVDVDCSGLVSSKCNHIAILEIAARETSGLNPVTVYVGGLGGHAALWLPAAGRGSAQIEVTLDINNHIAVQSDITTVEWSIMLVAYDEKD